MGVLSNTDAARRDYLKPLMMSLKALQEAKKRARGPAWDILHRAESSIQHALERRRSIFARRKPREKKKTRTKKPPE